MNITEKQKQQLIDLNDSRVNEILNLGLKVGEWYKYNNCILNYKETDNNNIKAYGIIPHSGWGDNYSCGNSPEQWIKATNEEVEQALINEAKRRGFKQGVKFISLSENRNNIRTISDKIDMNYYKDENFLTILTSKHEWDNCNGLQSNPRIFHNGVWAEIIDEKAELKQEIKELEVRLKELRKKL